MRNVRHTVRALLRPPARIASGTLLAPGCVVRGVLVLLAACSVDASLEDRAARREQLVADLVEPSNAYARVRLANYAVADGWDELPEWNPTALDLDDDLLSLGAAAFVRYPVQLWTDAPNGVRLELGGQTHTAATCATCHSHDGVAGRANATIDLGWGPGLVDVTTNDGSEPLAIPDLRPVRWLTHLQASGAVRQSNVTSLAIRIETLIITAHNEVVRPPRVVTRALAEYLWSLAPTEEAPPAPDAFTRTCGGCHAGEGLTGPPISLERVGTDPVAARSSDRGTGMYRVPSLRGVRDRARLLHDGSITSVDQLLDPARTAPGHRFGTTLPDDDRAVIVAYLRTL